MLRRASLSIAILLSACFAGQVVAAQDGLGSHWPNAVDVSANPNWHVYVFQQSGVKYLQVNDLNGNVREVVATAGGQFLVLPMGLDVSRVAVVQEPTSTNVNSVASAAMKTAAPARASSQPSQVVYRDDSVVVTVRADTSGNPSWSNVASPMACTPSECVGAQNPVGNH
jgi:hypothetical protein